MWNDLRFRLRALCRRSAEETQLNEELRFHFEKEVEKLRLAGMAEEERPRVARAFRRGRDIIGRKITLNEQPFTVVGVMPRGTAHPGNWHQPLAYGEDVDAWWAFSFAGDPVNRGSHYMEGIGRLKRDVSPAQAQADPMVALRAE